MKNLFLIIFAFLIMGCTVPSPAQELAGDKPHSLNNPNFITYSPGEVAKTSRFWVSKNLILSDTISGSLMTNRLIIKDSIQTDWINASDSMRTVYLFVEEIQLRSVSRIEADNNLWLNTNGDEINIGDYSLLISKGSQLINTPYDLDLDADVDIAGDLTVTGKIINVPAPINIPNVGGSSYEIDASTGSLFFLTLTDNSDITIGNIASGQEIEVWITGGLDMALQPFQLIWAISGPSEFWYREAGNLPATQTQFTDKYLFRRIGGTLYCEQFPGEAP